MKKVFYFLIIVFCIYVIFVFYSVYAYKFYNEKSGFIKPGEWSWYGDVATTIECSNEKCMLVLFSLKDGVNLKEFPIDENQTNVGKYDKLEDTPYQQGLKK